MIFSRMLGMLAAVGAVSLLGGCVGAKLLGGMAQNWEYQKLVEVLPEYTGLEDRTVAVLVDVDLATLYQYPELAAEIAGNVSGRIANNVHGARVIHPNDVHRWKYHTRHWNAMPYGQIAEELNVDRIVYIDIYEFRLNPPGNRWEWEGVCAANVGIIERESFAPDSFVQTFNVIGRFPRAEYIDRESTDERVIEFGVLQEFIRETAWLFYKHERPKYPDKYRPERQ
jgi:hypothetical protein